MNEVDAINAVGYCYLKRYLGIPKSCNTAALLYYTDTIPLYDAIRMIACHTFTKISFPSDSMAGHQLSFAKEPPPPPYDPLPILPDEFPREKPFMSLKKNFRFDAFRKIFNVGHYKVCSVETFHTLVSPLCRCIYCNCHLDRAHTCDV